MNPDLIQRVINKVKRIDCNAAEYIQYRFETNNISSGVNDMHLSSKYVITWLFTWSQTPQGDDYWSNIYWNYIELPDEIITKKGNRLT